MFDEYEYKDLLKNLGIDMEPYTEREAIPCPFCDGTGEEIMEFQGNTVASGCFECRGTGEAVELIGEELPKLPFKDKNGKF